VGSGHGYVADLLRHRQPALRYVGVDISWEMCRLARTRRAGRTLVVGDAVALPFADRSVDTVLDAATLMHVPEWRAALREEARVARSHLILHSVTVAEIADSMAMRKYAYGVPVFEGVLSRSQLIDELSSAGFVISGRYASLAYDLQDQVGVATSSETLVCARTSP
jgi:SAM-dependent methyltransferase